MNHTRRFPFLDAVRRAYPVSAGSPPGAARAERPDRTMRLARTGLAAAGATLALALLTAASPARADAVDAAAARLQSMLVCSPGARLPTQAERMAWRGAGVVLTGYAHDGHVVLDADHDDAGDNWEEMRITLPRAVAVEGLRVSQFHLARQQSGDTDADVDVTAYAEAAGELGAFAAARRLVPLPSAVPAGLDIANNVEDGHSAGFHAGYLRWATALSRQQADALAEPGSIYLPGPHRLPSVRFAGALAGAPGRFAFGCEVFGPDVTPVDGD